MNNAWLTGYLLGDADERFTKLGVLKLICEVMVANSEGERVPYRCEFIDADLIVRARPYLTSGRPVVFQAELDGRIYEDRGIKKGWSRFLRITRAEFPARTLLKEEVAKTTA